MTETKLVRKWSRSEEKTLLDAAAEGKNYEDIGFLLGRTAGACAIRLKKLCLEMSETPGADIANICNTYSITPQDLIDQKEIKERITSKKKPVPQSGIATPVTSSKEQLRSLLQAALALL